MAEEGGGAGGGRSGAVASHWASGLFPDRRQQRRAGGAGGAGARRQRPETLLELRWHVDVPRDGAAARNASQVVVRSVRPRLAPLLPADVDAAKQSAEQFAVTHRPDPHRHRFTDVSTGLRMRYMHYGGDERVVLLLHDVGDAGGCLSGLALNVASRGYSVYCLDLRGHGDTGASREGQYTPTAMADDVNGFVMQHDLYTRPVAVVGFGLGAAVGAAFASKYPLLVGALMLVEYSPDAHRDRLAFSYLQAAEFEDDKEALEFACERVWGHPARKPMQVMRHQRWRLETVGEGPQCRPKMDPCFLLQYTPEELYGHLASVRCHVLVVTGADSHVVSEELAKKVYDSLDQAETRAAARIPKTGHYVMEDNPLKLRDALLFFVLRHDQALTVQNKAQRAPEMLGIRPLPQYATVDEALKALQPRKIPNAEDIRQALEQAREGDEVASSDDEDEGLHRRTALSNESVDYFGFVG